MDESLDDLVRRNDPDRWLSSRFIADPGARADVIALYAFDHELARAPKVASNPLIGEIRLTWWREMLDEAYEGRTVRGHPTAQALAAVIEARGLARAPLETLIDARYRELDPTPMSHDEATAWARDTAGVVAEVSAGLLDARAPPGLAMDAGAAWVLARRLGDNPSWRPAFEGFLADARVSVRSLSAQAFPAVAHAALVGPGSDLTRRLRLMLAVARGRI